MRSTVKSYIYRLWNRRYKIEGENVPKYKLIVVTSWFYRISDDSRPQTRNLNQNTINKEKQILKDSYRNIVVKDFTDITLAHQATHRRPKYFVDKRRNSRKKFTEKIYCVSFHSISKLIRYNGHNEYYNVTDMEQILNSYLITFLDI